MTTNLADDTAFTKPLIKALRGHVDAAAASIASRQDGPGHHRALEDARPAAVAWVYMTVLVAWAEDHGLIDPWLRAPAEPARKEFLSLPGMTMTAWVARAFASLCVHPGTWCLLDPRYTPVGRKTRPSNKVLEDLAAWWETNAPSLRYEQEAGPGSLTGWLPGDLLQALSDERRKALAFCQTPWWVADFIIDLTLVPAASTFRDITLRTIDPCCGTGHFLIRTIDYLWELYTTGSLNARQAEHADPATGWAPVPPAAAIRRIIDGVHGCERDPLIAATARLRFVVAIGDLMRRSGLLAGPLRLDRIPQFEPGIVVGDSLLARVPGFSKDDYAALHPELAAIVNLGYPSERPTPKDEGKTS
ncbi:hypothetical protein ACGFJT_37060 [Actinomadura geliboluensis]|uniref:hypothetical protein n=1 Tax=Actinomadura geliboluensis TaxID=882440 RepID=UPI003721EAFD